MRYCQYSKCQKELVRHGKEWPVDFLRRKTCNNECGGNRTLELKNAERTGFRLAHVRNRRNDLAQLFLLVNLRITE